MATETNWFVIAREDLDDYLVAAGMAAYSSAALGSTQDDPFDRIMPDVAARIRAEVRGCKSNRVSNLANSIPPDLKTAACDLIIEQMGKRLAMGLPLNDDQKKAADEARKYLARIARCEVPIAQPSDPETSSDVQTGAPIATTLGCRPQQTGRKNSSRL